MHFRKRNNKLNELIPVRIGHTFNTRKHHVTDDNMHRDEYIYKLRFCVGGQNIRLIVRKQKHLKNISVVITYIAR